MDPSGQSRAYHGGQHYENFPVGSWLIPKHLRPAVLALYRFARTGDDLADEGTIEPVDRLAALSQLREGLGASAPTADQNAGVLRSKPPAFDAPFARYRELGATLRDTLNAQGVSLQHAHALLDAFEQDAQFRPMETEADVLAYCRKSAVPVGRMMLGFFGLTPNPQIEAAADAVCTGLQLANFAQDMGEDQAKGRHYFPQCWLPSPNTAISARMADWARAEIQKGFELPRQIRAQMRARQRPGAIRFPLEIAVTIRGGIEICEIVKRNPDAVWWSSPRIPAHRIPVFMTKGLLQLF